MSGDSPTDGRTATPGLRAHTSRTGPHAVLVTVSGEVDMASAPTLSTVVLDALSAAGEAQRVVLDLNRVTFFAVRGLDVLVEAHRHGRRTGRELLVVLDDAAPAAASLRFLAAGEGPPVHRSLTAALGHRARPVRSGPRASSPGPRSGRECCNGWPSSDRAVH